MKTLALSNGEQAIVDDDWYEMLSLVSWYVGGGYVRRTASRPGIKHIGPELIHRIIMDAQPGEFVDHINHNKLDNRRGNLRFCNQSQNLANSVPKRKRGGKAKGVFFNGRGHRKKWEARIGVDYGYLYIGSFETEREAVIAWNKKAKELFGEFANLNFPEKDYNKLEPPKPTGRKYQNRN